MIKAIIFDIGGVVVHTDFQRIYSLFGEQVGLPPGFVADYHKKNWDDIILGNISLEQFWKDMQDGGGMADLDYASIWLEIALANREVNHELLRVIDALRKRYSVGVVSNVFFTRLALDAKIDLYSHFDYAFLSCLEHKKKPDPEFYKLALGKSKVKPEEAVFIDDRDLHLEGAKSLGINVIKYEWPKNEDLFENLKNLGVVDAGLSLR